MAARIIFENDEIRVVHRPGSSDFTLVTFAALGHRPKGEWIWAAPPVNKLGIEAVGIVAKRENWYPAADMQAAAPAIRALLRPRTIGYGFSMGGYAVLKYGRLLGLTHGLAVSPQVSIDPAEVPADPRFHRHHDPRLHAGMAVGPQDVPAACFAVGDTKWVIDAEHLRRAGELPGVHVIALPFLKHSAIDRFTSTREIGAVLDLVLAGEPAILRAHLRRTRPLSPELHLWLARSAAARGHLKPAERLWARAEALGMSVDQILTVRGLAMRERLMQLFAQRRPQEARAFIDTAIEGQGGVAVGLVALGDYLHRRGMIAKAVECFRLALHTAPYFADAHLGLLQALRDLGRPEALARSREVALKRLASRPDDLAAVLALDLDPPGQGGGR